METEDGPFDLSRLLNQPVPDDIEIGVLKGYILNGPTIAGLVESFPHVKRLSVRFVYVDGKEIIGDVPDTMTISEFREEANAGRAKLVIEGDGGVPARVPELV
jgi:hypothetical protein